MSLHDKQIIRPVWPFILNHNSPQAQGLVAWYPMVHPGGRTVFDLAGRSYHLVGGSGSAQPTWGEEMKFDAGTSQYAEVDATPVTAAPLTISCWVKVRDLTIGSQVLCLCRGDNDNDWFSLVVLGNIANDPAALQVNSNTGGFQELTGGTLLPYHWHLIVGVYASSVSRFLYFDGAQKASGSNNCTPVTINRIAMGGLRRPSATGFYSGEIGDTRIYNRALSAAEVYALYDPQSRYDLYWELGRRATFFPAAGQIQALEARIGGQSSINSALAATRALTSQASGAAQSQAVTIVKRDLIATAQGRGAISGAAAVVRNLIASTQGRGAISGAAAVVRNLTGAVAGSSAVQSVVNAARALTARVIGVGRAIGSLFEAFVSTDALAIDDQTFTVTWEDDQTFTLASFAMTKFNSKIKPIVQGDDRRVRRTFKGLPAATIDKAWFTLKRRAKDSDSAAIFRKEVTVVANADGAITDADTTNGDFKCHFDISAANSLNTKAEFQYVFDVKVRRSTGQVHTFEQGTTIFARRITEDVS